MFSQLSLQILWQLWLQRYIAFNILKA